MDGILSFLKQSYATDFILQKNKKEIFDLSAKKRIHSYIHDAFFAFLNENQLLEDRMTSISHPHTLTNEEKPPGTSLIKTKVKMPDGYLLFTTHAEK